MPRKTEEQKWVDLQAEVTKLFHPGTDGDRALDQFVTESVEGLFNAPLPDETASFLEGDASDDLGRVAEIVNLAIIRRLLPKGYLLLKR